VTDDALISISQLSNLKTLELHQMKVTEASVSHLSRLKSWKRFGSIRPALPMRQF